MKLFLIAWVAVRELLYERVFYVLLSFSVLSLGLSLLLGQMTYAEQYKLTLDFMLAGIQLSMFLFSIFVGIGLFQREMALGSVSMVLSKPVSRTTFLLGKFLGQCIVQLAVCIAMTVVTLAICSNYDDISYKSVIQTVLLIYYEITLLTAITYFFAVNSGAITTAVVTICMFCVGHLRESVTQNMQSASVYYNISRLAKNVVPDLEMFNMKAFAAYGYTISLTEMGWATIYAICCVTFFLTIASVTFSRKDILT